MPHFGCRHEGSVLRLVPSFIWGEPNLKKTTRFFSFVIHFRMYDTSTCAHVLNSASREAFFVAHAVSVAESATDDVGEDFCVSVGVCSKAGAGLDEIIV